MEFRNDFNHKITIVEKEAAETQYWLEHLEGSGTGNPADLRWLIEESTGLLAIFTSLGKINKSRK